jgi:hypothetical protein
VPSSRWLEQLPPTAGIQDASVRTFLDALKNAWALRNGDIGADDSERFVTKGEFFNEAKKAYFGFVSGAIGTSPPGGPPGGPGTHETIATDIVNSLLYQMLGARIPDIRPPYETLSEIDGILARAMQGITLNKNKITRLSEENDARLREIRALWTVRDQYDTLIFDSVMTEAGRAERIDSMRARYGGSIEAMIASIETVTVTSNSAVARALAVLTATMGASVRTFFNLAAAGGVAGIPVYKSETDAMRSPKAGDQWYPPNSVMDIPAYTRRGWDGTKWVLGGPAIGDFATGGVLNESEVRLEKDKANASYISHIWAAVTGSAAIIQDGAITSATPANAFASKWTTLQTAVFDADGKAHVTKLRQDLIVGTPMLADGVTPDWSQVGFLGVGATAERARTTRHQERLLGAYTLRIESQGVIGGFGLAMTQTGDEGPQVAFGVRADRFWIADPNAPADAWAADKVPFAVEKGVVYLKVAHISNYISSDNFAVGNKGWKISRNGDAEFNDVTVRGTIYAERGVINRLIVTGAVEDELYIPNNTIATYTHNEGRRVMLTCWSTEGYSISIHNMDENSFSLSMGGSGGTAKFRYW